jgi:hypothetical protein
LIIFYQKNFHHSTSTACSIAQKDWKKIGMFAGGFQDSSNQSSSITPSDDSTTSFSANKHHASGGQNMKQHTLLGIAAALTAFVLVVIGALVGQMSQIGAPVATDTVIVPTEAPVSAPVALDPTVEALIREREAAYQQALAEANRRLAEANRAPGSGESPDRATDQPAAICTGSAEPRTSATDISDLDGTGADHCVEPGKRGNADKAGGTGEVPGDASIRSDL